MSSFPQAIKCVNNLQNKNRNEQVGNLKLTVFVHKRHSCPRCCYCSLSWSQVLPRVRSCPASYLTTTNSSTQKFHFLKIQFFNFNISQFCTEGGISCQVTQPNGTPAFPLWQHHHPPVNYFAWSSKAPKWCNHHGPSRGWYQNFVKKGKNISLF